MRAQKLIVRSYENRFWIACVIIGLGCTLSFAVSSIRLVRETDSNLNSIKSSRESIQNVLSTAVDLDSNSANSVSVHPNQQTVTAMDGQIDLAKQTALAAWTIRYQQQSPYLVIGDEIPTGARDAITSQLPEESVLSAAREPIDHSYRSTYRLSVTQRLKAIAENIGTSIKSLGQDLPDALHLSPDEVVPDIVIWDTRNSEYWTNRVTAFQGRNGNTAETPTSAQVMVTQQDLWVLENMLNLIGNINGDALSNDLAIIKKIDHVLVGKDAVIELGELHARNMRARKTDAKNADQTTGLASRPQTSYQKRPNAATVKNAFDEKSSDSPFHGRYVDRMFQRISESELKDVISSELGLRSHMAVLKRIPVRLALRMDEQKIAAFLEHATRSPLKFEVRQIRINRHVPNEKIETNVGSQTNSTESNLARNGGITADSDNAADSSNNDSSFAPPELRTDFDVNVEFIGSITIYNPIKDLLLATDN